MIPVYFVDEMVAPNAGSFNPSARKPAQVLPAAVRPGQRRAGALPGGGGLPCRRPTRGGLTTDEMRERDRLVFSLAVAHGAPLVWNLAGGYQRDRKGTIPPVLRLHRQTMTECI